MHRSAEGRLAAAHPLSLNVNLTIVGLSMTTLGDGIHGQLPITDDRQLLLVDHT